MGNRLSVGTTNSCGFPEFSQNRCNVVPSDKAKAMQITLTPPAREVIAGLRDDLGISQTEAMTRLLDWFGTTDRAVRVAILTKDADAQRRLIGPALAKSAMMESFKIDDLDVLNYQQLFDLIEAAHEVLERQIRALRHDATGKPDPVRTKRGK